MGDTFNQAFPQQRFAQVCIVNKQGEHFESAPTQARGDPESPLSDHEIELKYHQLADLALGTENAEDIKAAIAALGSGKDIQNLIMLITQPPNQSPTDPGE